jgi:hypothetical protein
MDEAQGVSVSTEPQTASAVLMVEPAAFGFNPETAPSNRFAARLAQGDVAERARAEFHGLAARLAGAGVDVHVLADTADPAKPDAVFPNNWISFHRDGTLVTYPMAAPTRRAERRAEAVEQLLQDRGFAVGRRVDLSPGELQGRFLEGTGSLVLDRPGRRAFACLSERTHPRAVAEFDALMGYSSMLFTATDRKGQPLYHTNVMMSLGSRFALVCLECVAPKDRAPLVEAIERGGRDLIEVGREQLAGFACNLLELRDRQGRPLVALSSRAGETLRPNQRRRLESLAGRLVEAPIPTIEAVGGGGVRCMIAEIHLPPAH